MRALLAGWGMMNEPRDLQWGVAQLRKKLDITKVIECLSWSRLIMEGATCSCR